MVKEMEQFKADLLESVSQMNRADVIRLSLADQECFAQALLSPPQPVPALERAFTRRNKLLR